MNQRYTYALGDIVWVVDEETSIAKNFVVHQVTIIVTQNAVNINYILQNKNVTKNVSQNVIYASLQDALATL